MFDADRPIEASTQDRLNRTAFANYLTRSILDQDNPESFVIGLYGEPGSGKTSLLNLVAESLAYASGNLFDEEKPLVYYFNPWNYTGQDLSHYFFQGLISEIENSTYLENKKQILSHLKLYLSFFTHKKKWSLLNWKFKRRERENLSGASNHDLILVKSEFNKLLKTKKHKIIIIIDNVSRLLDTELRQLFQIIKCTADFNQTTYLLACDKAEKNYPEKVNLYFDVPSIVERDLELLLSDRLQKSMLLVKQEAWNNELWSDIYSYCLKYFFKNVSDVNRYVNSLNLSYPRVKEMVNPVDYFALTAIEVFMPEIYLAIRDNKDLFTDLIEEVYNVDQDSHEKDKARCDEIFSRNKHINPSLLIDLMIHLFPRLQHFYRPNESYYYSESLARKNQRLSSPDVFDLYFQLSMPSLNIPDAEFFTLLSVANDEQAFSHVLMRLNKDETIGAFLERLDSPIIKKMPLNNVAPMIHALLDAGDLLPEGVQGPLNLNTLSRIHRIIHGLLRLIDSTDERFLILQKAIANATHSIYVIVYELHTQTNEHQEESTSYLPLEFRDLTPEQLHSLTQLAASRIAHWAEIGRLQEHPKLFSLLEAWRYWDSTHHCQRYVEQLVESDLGLVAFLVSVLNEPISEALSKYEKNAEWHVYLEAINEFISPEKLIPHARLLFQDPHFEKLREKEQLALMIFLDLVQADTVKFIPNTV